LDARETQLCAALAAVGITFLYLLNVSAQDEKNVGLSREYDACMEKVGWCDLKNAELYWRRNRTPRCDAKQDLQRGHGAGRRAGKMRLREAQKAWVKFRDANVDFYRDPNGGTAATVAEADRYLMMTAQRASELEKFKE
jgi:uncharacterized protein YecT (DUF1311 family)